MERKAGTSAGRVMLPWRKLRQEQPGLFEGLLVWQQPSAFADAVTFAWQIRQEAAEYEQAVRPCQADRRLRRRLDSRKQGEHVAAAADAGLRRTRLHSCVPDYRHRHGSASETGCGAGEGAHQRAAQTEGEGGGRAAQAAQQHSVQADRAACSMPCSTQHHAEQKGQHSAQQSSTKHAEQTQQHAACHVAHSIMQGRQSSMQHAM